VDGFAAIFSRTILPPVMSIIQPSLGAAFSALLFVVESVFGKETEGVVAQYATTVVRTLDFFWIYVY
jgi:hypothetical protein